MQKGENQPLITDIKKDESEIKENVKLDSNVSINNVKEDSQEIKGNFFQKAFSGIRNAYHSESVIGASLQLSNSTIGSGILFLPYVLKEMGIILGLSFFLFSGFLTSLTMFVLYKCVVAFSEVRRNNQPKAEKVEGEGTIKKDVAEDVVDYEQIGCYCFGSWFSYFVQITVIASNFGGCMSYSIVVYDILKGWMGFDIVPGTNWGFLSAMVLILTLIPFILISMNKKISSLRVSGYLTIVAIFFFIIFVVLGYIINDQSSQISGNIRLFPHFGDYRSYLSILSILGIVNYAYAAHSNLVYIVGQYKQKNRYKAGIAVFLNIEFVYFVYCIIAEFGYLTFLDNTKKDIVQSYNGSGWLASCLRVFVLLAILATFPQCFYPTRYTLTNLIKDVTSQCMKLVKKKSFTKGSMFEKYFDLFLLITITTFVGTICISIGIFYPYASDIFGLIGGTCSTLQGYIFPCFFFLKLVKPKNFFVKAGIITLLCYGIIFGIVVSVLSVLKLFFSDWFNSS